MVLELHIWGPAFGLPSIDAECIAAIAYLRHCLNDEEWVLVASSDASVSPTSTLYTLQLQGNETLSILSCLLAFTKTDPCHLDELPALQSGTIWISRFRNIVDYLRKYSAGEWDLERGLSKQQRADSVA
jgi:sorting and assembly machinery component 37